MRNWVQLFLLLFYSAYSQCDFDSYDDYLKPEFNYAFTDFIGQDNVQLVINLDQRYRSVELDWIRAYTDDLDYSEAEPGQWSLLPSRFDCSVSYSTIVRWRDFFVEQAHFDEVYDSNLDLDNYDYWETKISASFFADYSTSTEPGHRELVYERWERQLLVLRFRFPKYVVVTLGDDIETGLDVPLNPWVYVRMLGIQHHNVTHPCPSCIDVTMQTVATWPIKVNYTDLAVYHNEEAVATLTYVEGSDVNCEPDVLENCLQNWRLRIKPEFCALDGPYQMVWTAECRPTIEDCPLQPQYRKPTYTLDIQTSELCPGIDELVVDASIELFRDADRSSGLDLWRYYFLDDMVHATITIEPELGFFMNGDAQITGVNVTNAFLFQTGGVNAKAVVDKTWTSEGSTVLLDFPAHSSLFTVTSNDPEPYVLRVEGTAELSDYDPNGRRRRLFSAPHFYSVEIQMYVVPFTKTLTDPSENYNVKTETEFILDWRTQQYFLDAAIPIPNTLRREIEGFFSIEDGFDSQTDFRMLEIKTCKESSCVVVWDPTNIAQFWPEEFEADVGEGWTLTSTMITFVEQDTPSTPTAEMIRYVEAIETYPGENFYTSTAFTRIVALSARMSIYTGATSGVGIIPGTDLNSTNSGSDTAANSDSGPTPLSLGDKEIVLPVSQEGSQEWVQESIAAEFALVFSSFFLSLLFI